MTIAPSSGNVWKRKASGVSGEELNIGFGINGNSRDFQGSGWSDPEAEETWAIGGVSFLKVPAPATPANYLMIFKLRPHVVAGRLNAQRLRVFVNDVETGDFSLAKPDVRACRVLWSVIAGRAEMDLRFEMADAVAPASLTQSSDSRALGIAFSDLQMFADPVVTTGVAPSVADAAGVAVDIDTISKADRISMADLMLQFESLGQNCEFGLVQRKCGAEPLGLLRFSSTPLSKLLAALWANFEGMGRPETVHVQVSPNGRELMISDSQFGFLYHAFVQHGEMSVEALHQREVRRVPFLIRKLLEDLSGAEKIFVFKGMGPLSVEQVFPLVAALRRYGPNYLLFVNLADADHPAGTVEIREPGFLIGYLSRFAPTEDAADFDLAQWVRICRESYRLRLAAEWLGRASSGSP